MVSQSFILDVEVAGTAAEQALARDILQLMRARGRFMSADAPIRVSIVSLAEYFEAQGTKSAEKAVRAAAEANPAMFAVEDIDGVAVLVTTRAGRRPVAAGDLSPHTFKQRLKTPLPKPEHPRPQRERHRIDSGWATIAERLTDLLAEAYEEEEDEEIFEPAEVEVIAVEEPAPPVEEVAAVEVPAPATPRVITVPNVVRTDVTGVDDIALASAIRERLLADPRIANFGEQWMVEERVPRFSRGDLRRLREYLQEQEQPMTDDMLAQDVLGVRPGSPEFDLTRFAVDYRLSREKEFEFVGTANQRFWSTTGLAQIGTSRRKPNELGTDYRYLIDETPETIEYRSIESLDHTLTFFEHIHGLLPYDGEMQRLLPAPLLPNQRGVVLTFECPQSYTTYLVELRYPTPNRGGFILGLDDFYAENLVPGSVLSISRTENDGHYRVEYLPETGASARLLEIDDRRAQRYVFRPTTYACGVDETMLLTEERFGRLNGEKPLDDKIRRRPEAVVAATFERVGEIRDANYSAEFSTLLAGVNVERPMSAVLLRSTLDNDDTGAFSRDPEGQDAYTYVPGTTP
ncbi:MAG: hypothetical protein ACKOWF_02030 [Chloroflexota bacterium]